MTKNKPVGGKEDRYTKRRLARLEILQGRRDEKKKLARREHIHSPSRRSKPAVKRSAPKYDKIVKLPQNFSLLDNYPESIRKIDEVRKINENNERNVYVNFDHIKRIGAGAALVLASEFHVANLGGHKWRRAMDGNWDPEIRRLLQDMGFYRFLNLRRDTAREFGIKSRKERFLKFASGRADIKNAGKNLREIGDKIQKFAGNNLPSGALLDLCVNEAILNIRHHAYAKEEKLEESSRWWISASLDKSSREIKVICYDRGLSIPRTLILNFPEIFRNLLSIANFAPEHDALLIQSAIKENRTSTGRPGRGNGLPQLKRFIDNNQNGQLIVMSRNGKTTYRRNPGQEPQWKAEELPEPIMGTLIVWSIMLEQPKI